MNRTPPPDVRRKLRREVGFGCPIPECGTPYLSWHHFDPPWHIEHHHRPEGMIALCLKHAGFADANAYEKNYLRGLKLAGRPEADEVRGELTWMRREVLALIGGTWYYKTPVMLQVGSTNAVWFGRDDDGYLLLNLRMPSLSGCPRVRIEENFFTVGRDHVVDVECAARGRVIRIEYPNGDRFEHQYRDIADEDDLRARYSEVLSGPVSPMIQFPLTVVEVSEQTHNAHLGFGPRHTNFASSNATGIWSINNGIGVKVSVSPLEEQLLFCDGRAPGGSDRVYYAGTCVCRLRVFAVRFREQYVPGAPPPTITQPCQRCGKAVVFDKVTA